ncbi:MAG: DUF1847 domain-containing protein [Bacteroidota bacterium]
MRYGNPLFSGRVAPRCTIADSILIAKVNYGKITSKVFIPWKERSFISLVEILIDERVDTIVCGGINKEDKKLIRSQEIKVIDNVACSEEEIINAIDEGVIRPGYGFIDRNNIQFNNSAGKKSSGPSADFNCLRCPGNECRLGKPCPYVNNMELSRPNDNDIKKIDSAMDISLEEERNLCRLSELIYFALDMKYKKIGIAYCTELEEATEILVSILRRFFEVNPVCCKISGSAISDTPSGGKRISCNPVAQAEILNRLKTDINIMVGLCIGADSIFSDLSNAPVTTLFVKDRSLANNPIGALYSEYYLKEVKSVNS